MVHNMMKYNRLSAIIALITILSVAPCMLLSYGGSSSVYAQQQQKNTPPEGSTAYYDLTIRQLFKDSKWNEGKKLLDEAIKKYPQMSAFYELMGRYYVHMADRAMPAPKATDAQRKKAEAVAFPYYDKARYYLIRAINIDEKNVQARFLMLQVETDTRHYSSAIVYCNELLEENPYNEDLWRKKIDLYRRLGNNAEADRLLERIYTIYPADEQLRRDFAERKASQARVQGKNGDLQGQEQSLRQLIDLEPKNAEYHRTLINLLYRNGRINEAAEAAGHAAAQTLNKEFVEKRTSMLCEMNRHREAVEYVKTLKATTRGIALDQLLHQLEIDAANAAQYNDAYVSYAKIYDQQKSKEALDYLINTSIERWYLDDALMYINEALKSDKSKKMRYNQYLIHKRLGNTRRANALLFDLYESFPDDEEISENMMLLLLDSSKELMDQGQYSEAVPMLEKVFYAKAYPYLKDAAFQRLYNCYYQTKQYAKAEKMLTQMEGVKRITQTAALYNAWGKPKKALDFLADAYRQCPESDVDNRNLIAYSYEEILLPYVKNLLANNRVNEAVKQLKEAIDICPNNVDVLRYGITAAQRKGDVETMAQYVAKGRALYPNDPYFILKDAQMRHLSGDHKATLEEIKPLLDEYTGDSVLIALYVESNMEIAKEYLEMKMTDDAIEVLNSALDVSPDNSELYYWLALAYEQKKDWNNAIECYHKYKPGFAELAEYRHHLEEMVHHTLRNSISLEYQQARPGDEDVISGNAYVNYSRIINKENNLNVGLAYAGRDGATTQGDTEMTKGGTGVQLSAGWEHQFTQRLTGKAELAVASRYFPILMARLSGSYTFNNDWVASLFASYRLLRSYSGKYGWVRPEIGYDKALDKPIYGDAEYVRTGWKESKKSMIQVGAGIEKTINQFVLSGEASGLLFASNIYFNSNVKMKFFPVEGNTSNIFAVAGLGTAPESSLIDRSLPIGFDKLNTFVGMGGSYFVNRWVTLGLAGTWYTMLSQTERLATTYTVNDPYIRGDYRNYFYIHASVVLSFPDHKKPTFRIK